MRELRLKYIIKDKVDYTNEVISKKPGVGIRKIKFLLNTFEFQQRKSSRMSSRHSRFLTAALSIKHQQLVSNFFPILSRSLLHILQHYKLRKVSSVGHRNVQQQLLSEKVRIANLLEICRTRNLFFKLALVHSTLFSLISLPTLLHFCTAFFGTAAFFPLELWWLLRVCHQLVAAPASINASGIPLFINPAGLSLLFSKGNGKEVLAVSAPITLSKKKLQTWSTAWIV